MNFYVLSLQKIKPNNMKKETEKFADILLTEITKFQAEPAFPLMTPKAVAIRIETIIYEQKIELIKQRNSQLA